MNKPIVSKIYVYPIKSLDPVALSEAEIGVHSLKHDRTFAMVTKDGRFVNGKRTGRVNQLKADYDLENNIITLGERDTMVTESFELKVDNQKLNDYFSDFFELDISLVRSDKGELMDIPQQSSVTILSTASYQSLLKDFPNHSLEDFRLRFRANIEFDGTDAFWEEQLISAPNKAVHFTIGNVTLFGITPRARCNVPPRNPHTGETDKTFVKKMMASREHTLPSFSKLTAFGNMYHLTIDTYLPPSEEGKKIRVGDEVKIGEVINLNNS